MVTVGLNKDDALDQIVRYGFLPNEIPTCFSADMFAEDIHKLLPLIEQKKGAPPKTAPVNISIYKNEAQRRILSLPNPESFLHLAQHYAEYWEQFNEFARSEHSLSRINYLWEYKAGVDRELINTEKLKDELKIGSGFLESIKACIRAAIGYKYRLRVDISSCYASIYTHSITWAICGKDSAKEQYRNKSLRTNEYNLGDAADKCMMAQKNNETNGIIVGPFTSRIFSEIVLAGVDKELNKSGLVFKRFVDDYRFYFRTKDEAIKGLRTIERILNEYNLSLNHSKTLIELFPYERIKSLSHELDDAYRRGGVFDMLNSAANLHSNGEKGAFKYALKTIKDKSILKEDFDAIFPLLVNIMLLEPGNAHHIVDILKKNESKLDKAQLARVVQGELATCIQENLQQESAMLLYMVREFSLNTNAENISGIIDKGDDYSRIIALDIYCNKRGLISGGTQQMDELKSCCEKLSEELKKEKYEEEHWLLLYEVERHDLLKEFSYSGPQMNAFFQMLLNSGVTFYSSIV